MHAEDEYFAVADDHVGFLDVRTTGTNRLDFPAFEHDSGLELLFDEIVVERFFVVDDAHDGFPSDRAARMLESAILQDSMDVAENAPC